MTKRNIRNNKKTRKTRKIYLYKKSSKLKNYKNPKKHTLKGINKKYIGGETSPEFKKQIELRDNFRRMFKTLFTMIYESQDKNKTSYDKAISDLLSSLKSKGHKLAINTLIPITNNYIPIDKKTYSSFNTKLIGFVPAMCIIIYNLKNTNDIIRLLVQFNRSSGNINLMSIKNNITALSTALENGNSEVIKYLLKLGADINLLSEPDKNKLSQIVPVNEHIQIQKKDENVENAHVPINIEETISNKLDSNKQEINKQDISKPDINKPDINKLIIPFDLPGTDGYSTDIIPEFWKPIFNTNDTELMNLREKITNMLVADKGIKIENNVIEKTWSICEIVQTMIPSYHVQTKKEHYMQSGIFYNDLDIDFIHYNILLCACLIIFGILSNKMIGQNYEIVFKGGKAIQLVLAQIPSIPQYTSEDIDILVKPKDNVEYNKDEIKNLSSHIGYLIKWFLSSTQIMTNISVLLPETSSNPKANLNIIKISYIKSVKRYDYKKGMNVEEYRPLSDVDFKDIPAELMPYFNKVVHYPFYIEELQTNVLFICPYIGALIDEKLFFYSKYMSFKILLKKGEKITEPSYENISLYDCDFYLNKFAKSILALTYGLEKKRNINVSNEMIIDKQKKFIMNRLSKLNVRENISKEVVTNLFP